MPLQLLVGQALPGAAPQGCFPQALLERNSLLPPAVHQEKDHAVLGELQGRGVTGEYRALPGLGPEALVLLELLATKALVVGG